MRHHCGTENAEQAKFCKGCGESLVAAAPSGAKPALPDAGNSAGREESLIVPYASPAEKPAAEPLQASDPAPLPPFMALPEPAAPGNRTTIALLAAVVLIALACGGAWLLLSGQAENATAVVAPAPAPDALSGPAMVVPVAAEPADAALRQEGGEAGMQAQKPGSSLVKHDSDAQVQKREAQAKRRAEQEAKRRADLEEQQRMAQAARTRELEARQQRLEQTRRRMAAQQAEVRTPQQVCAERPNFISRSLCEARECQRPERANAPFCIEMRERQKATHNEALPLN